VSTFSHPSAAPPVLGGQLFHYPGAPNRLRLPPHYLSYLEWSRCCASAQFVRFRLILNELVSQRAYAPLRRNLTRYGREVGSAEPPKRKWNATDAQSATDVAARGINYFWMRLTHMHQNYCLLWSQR
jgi:hypothetical protein